jgi:pimeloyl-ACP methyl ester carboxylesterase
MTRCALLLAAALLVAGCGGASHPKPVKDTTFPGWIVAADGHKVHYDCRGRGSPTVVFLNGWGADSTSWQTVFAGVQRLTRACEYDRLGTGVTGIYAQLPDRARDARDQVDELEQLLRNADIGGPYVLVGHSWGGALARLYAGTHDDVGAVVLVDSASPGQDEALRGVLPPQPSDPLASPEDLAWAKSLTEAATVTSLGSRPLVVITAGSDFPTEPRFFPIWSRLQARLAALSSDSVHVLVPTSSHAVQSDAPATVVTGVRAAVRAVRADARLPSCRAIFGADAHDRKCLTSRG